MALWIMGFGGTVPIGNLIAGPIIDATSVTAVMLAGAAVALGLAWYGDLARDPSGRRHPRHRRLIGRETSRSQAVNQSLEAGDAAGFHQHYVAGSQLAQRIERGVDVGDVETAVVGCRDGDHLDAALPRRAADRRVLGGAVVELGHHTQHRDPPGGVERSERLASRLSSTWGWRCRRR